MITTIESKMLAGGVVPVLRHDDLGTLNPLVAALLTGGVTAIELTMTMPDAHKALGQISGLVEEAGAVLGMGSVTQASDAIAAMDAGAQFVVTPVVDLGTIAACRERGVPVMCGAYTPSEILIAWRAGATAVKVFPASTLGPAYLKAVREPMPYLRLLPTGGVTLENTGEFIRAGAVAVGVGGSLLKRNLIAAEDWTALSILAAAFVAEVKRARGV